MLLVVIFQDLELNRVPEIIERVKASLIHMEHSLCALLNEQDAVVDSPEALLEVPSVLHLLQEMCEDLFARVLLSFMLHQYRHQSLPVPECVEASSREIWRSLEHSTTEASHADAQFVFHLVPRSDFLGLDGEPCPKTLQADDQYG